MLEQYRQFQPFQQFQQFPCDSWTAAAALPHY
jgi:hypothetical protein